MPVSQHNSRLALARRDLADEPAGLGRAGALSGAPPGVSAAALESARRNHRLLLGRDAPPANGALPGVLRPRGVPARARRAAERLRMKTGLMNWEQAWLAPLMHARREVLGAAAGGPPRLLVRVDEFPDAGAFYNESGAGLDASRRFHTIMLEAGVRYLTAVLPEPALDPLNPRGNATRPLEPGEIDFIEDLGGAGVVLAQHGTSHRTRYASPRRRSELIGLEGRDLRAVLDRGRATLAALGIAPRVFVPPFNRFSANQYEVLAESFDVICAGPESVALMGFHGGPLWRGEAVYLPCYHPLYSTAAEVLPALGRIIDLAPGTWVPLVLHSSWESSDSFASIERLARRIAPYTASWEDFLAELDRSRVMAPSGGIELPAAALPIGAGP